MIVVVAFHAAGAVKSRLEELGFRVEEALAGGRAVLCGSGADELLHLDHLKQLRAWEGVEEVHFSQPSTKVVGQESRIVDLGEGVLIGGDAIVIMAGPCTIESESQIFATAEAVAHAGATVLRGGAYKPSTSPYSFRGMGVKGLELIAAAGKRFGLKVITEVMDPRKVDLVAQHSDILQIGARNMQNYDLLHEVGQSSKPVLLKRGLSARYEEWLMAAEHVASSGNEQIILCERGIRSFESGTRNMLDLASVPVMKELAKLPVIVDPSQATGKRDLIAPMSLAAIAAGADGLLIEVHVNPEQAIKDGAQSLAPAQFEALVPQVQAVAGALGRSVLLPVVA
ncbi:MAG: 3-deoxy-7-phosphoheptulonate synthase [Chthonomonas sp.]|nr:3-deoxy-7-phosphoheptulonate synthase [Chthonomonas sp.]